MSIEKTSSSPIQTEDVARWLTFTGFWGAIFYLLACVSLIVTHRRQPLKINARTTLVGLGVHLATFVTLGSLGSAIYSLVRGKRTTEQAEERIASGALERATLAQGIGGAVGAAVPFGLAVASLRVAERVTGESAFSSARDLRLPQALGVMTLLSGLTSLTVSRIAGWVARDAKQGSSM